MTTAPLRTALLGYGTAGRVFHAPFLTADPRYDLRVVSTGDPERAERARADVPRVTVLDDARSVVDHASELDLVVIGTPPATHVDLAVRALDAGLDVVVDKPFAPTSAEARGLVDHAEALSRKITVFQNRRWDGDFLTVRGLLEEGRLGQVHAFESRFEWWMPEGMPGWKGTTSVADGGGILLDLGTHLVDQALQLFGPVDQVHADVATRYAGDGSGADDDVVLLLRHRSGVSSRLTMSSVCALPGPRFRVLGSRAGYLKHGLDGQEAALGAGTRPGAEGFGVEDPDRWGTLGTGDDVVPVPTERGDYGRFYAQLARALREGEPLPVDPRDAVDVLEVIEHARHQTTPTR